MAGGTDQFVARFDAALAEALRRSKLTLAVAESCTGGLIGHRLTEVPGSSDYFKLGVVSYSNEAKVRVLGVPEHVIAAHGAVSDECVRAMAERVRLLANSDLGLAVSGIAGPTGGNSQKPVGTVFVALAHAQGTISEHHEFARDRSGNKVASAEAALALLLRHVHGDV